MTIAMDVGYTAPATLDEALASLTGDHGPTTLLAGGTDVIPWVRDGLLDPGLIVDLKRLPGLSSIEVRDHVLEVGCLATFSDLLRSTEVRDRVPLLTEMAGMVASVGIRNRATLVGNICSAVPSCDAGPALLALDASVHLTGPDGRRTVPIDAWFLGPRHTALAPGEIVTGIALPLPGVGHGAAFARLSRTRGEDLAQASVAVLLRPDGAVRVAFGAVAPTPVRGRRIEAGLRGPTLDPDDIDDVVELVVEEIAPITDLRATDRYRLRMCEVMLRRALTAAAARTTGEGPAYGTPLM
jgi:CO/xanthine dehydrogenase FAD-binding subunit